ncbi:MAG: hypothetical protein PHQ43_11405, partial [Dehalococcoidales bacterium]|nr:hypothetical protein [Dehalococcoidales bacterium]
GLSVNTPGNADIGVGVNAATASVNINGVGPNQVNIGGANVAVESQNLASFAATSLAGAAWFNQQSYYQFVKPLRDKLETALIALTMDEQNLDLTMSGLAKTISVLQDHNNQLQDIHQQIVQMASAVGASIEEKEKQKTALAEQFGYIDSEFQHSIDRDNTTLQILRDLNGNLEFQIEDHESRLNSMVAAYQASQATTSNLIEVRYQSLNTQVAYLYALLATTMLTIIAMAFVLVRRYANPVATATPTTTTVPNSEKIPIRNS